MRWNPFRRRGDAAERRDLGPGSVSWPLDNFGGSIGASAVHVDANSAFRLGPVFAAARLLTDNISSTPIQVYRRSGDVPSKLPTPALFLNPCAQGTFAQWLARAVVSLVYRGNAIGLVTQFDQFERPLTIEWVNPDNVTCNDMNPEIGEPGSFTNPQWYYMGVEIPAARIVHIPWVTMPGRVLGMSPMMAAASTVSTGLLAREFTQGWFQSGGHPPGTFKNTTQTVDQRQADTIKRRLVQSIRTHEPIVYGADWDYTPLTVSPTEAQFIETMRLGATEIAAIYGVPPEMIGGETGGKSHTYSSPEQREIELVQFSLMPWLRRFEEAFSALLPRGQYVRFNADALIRSDAPTRYANYKVAREIGLMSVDEIRAREDMPPLPNGQGSDFTPLGSAPAPVADAPSSDTPQGDAPPPGDQTHDQPQRAA